MPSTQPTVIQQQPASASIQLTGRSRPARFVWLGQLMLVAAAAAFMLPDAAQAEVQIAIKIAPPAARAERAPAPRRDMVWIPGFWDYQRGHHVWVEGRWERERPGYRWVEANWVKHKGRWILVRGYWARTKTVARHDQDRDGVRNRVDSDRDGDGVRNRRDRRPDDSRRR